MIEQMPNIPDGFEHEKEEWAEPQIELPSDYESVSAAVEAHNLFADLRSDSFNKAGKQMIARVMENCLFVIDKAMISIRGSYETEESEE